MRVIHIRIQSPKLNRRAKNGIIFLNPEANRDEEIEFKMT